MAVLMRRTGTPDLIPGMSDPRVAAGLHNGCQKLLGEAEGRPPNNKLAGV